MSAESAAARLHGLAADPCLVDHYAESARHCRTVDLVTQRETLGWQLAELGAESELAGDFATFVVANLEGIERELTRRRSLYSTPGAPDVGHLPDTGQWVDDLDAIKRALDLERTVGEFSPVQWERHGTDSLFCRCPFTWHDDSTPSFHLTPSKQLWKCHGCGFGGDVIEFLRLHMGGVKTGTAIAFARSLAGLPMPTRIVPVSRARGRLPVQIR